MFSRTGAVFGRGVDTPPHTQVSILLGAAQGCVGGANARTFGQGVNRSTVWRTLRRNGVPPRRGPQPRGPLGIFERYCLMCIVLHSPMLTQLEMVSLLWAKHGIRCSKPTVCRALKYMRLTYQKRKKINMAVNSASNLRRRRRFQLQRRTIRPQDVVFVDEAGLSAEDTERTHGYSQQGERFEGSVDQSERRTMNFNMAMGFDGVLPCTFAFRGMNTGNLFEWWLVWMVLPQMRAGQWLIMDNARIHRRRYIRPLCYAHGVNLLFLPRYSPEYNPIEMAFGDIKMKLQRKGRIPDRWLAAEWNIAAQAISASTCAGYYRHSGWG